MTTPSTKLKRSFSHDYHAPSIYLSKEQNADSWAKLNTKTIKKPNNRSYTGFFK